MSGARPEDKIRNERDRDAYRRVKRAKDLAERIRAMTLENHPVAHKVEQVIDELGDVLRILTNGHH